MDTIKRHIADMVFRVLAHQVAPYCIQSPQPSGDYAERPVTVKEIECTCTPAWEEQENAESLIPHPANPVEKWLSQTHNIKQTREKKGYITLRTTYMAVPVAIHCQLSGINQNDDINPSPPNVGGSGGGIKNNEAPFQIKTSFPNPSAL
jgi:hypothetical protein